MKLRSNRHSSLLAVCAVSILMSGSMASTMASMRASANTDPKAPAPAPQILGEVPRDIPFPDADGKIYFTGEGGSRRATTINPYLQMRLQAYIKDRGNPIAAVVVADVRTGKVLAMAQGKTPESWGAIGHSALHAKFPAASLFKTVITAAAIEVSGYDTNNPVGLIGGCANVNPNAVWLQDYPITRARARSGMSLRRAYGKSCNNFFAKIAVDEVGIGSITEFATRLGFGSSVPADFSTEVSHMNVPTAQFSSAYTVGRFAAGFGPASTSAAHIAWQMLAIANDGIARPLVLFDDTPVEELNPGEADTEAHRVLEADTARQIRDVMEATVRGGTASTAFGRGRYRKLREVVGGKTGTLTGKTPAGLTTLFSGMAPLDSQPEVVVATIVLLQDRWIIKAPMLAAEAFSAYFDMKNNNITSMESLPSKKAKIAKKYASKRKKIRTSSRKTQQANQKVARSNGKRSNTH